MDKRLRFMADLIEPHMVPPGSTVRLSRDHDPGYTGQVPRQHAAGLLLGRVPASLRHHAEPDEHEVGTVVRGAGRSQMVQPPGNRGDSGTGAACDRPQVPRRRPRGAGADDAGESRARGGTGHRAGRRLAGWPSVAALTSTSVITWLRS